MNCFKPGRIYYSQPYFAEDRSYNHKLMYVLYRCPSTYSLIYMESVILMSFRGAIVRADDILPEFGHETLIPKPSYEYRYDANNYLNSDQIKQIRELNHQNYLVDDDYIPLRFETGKVYGTQKTTNINEGFRLKVTKRTKKKIVCQIFHKLIYENYTTTLPSSQVSCNRSFEVNIDWNHREFIDIGNKIYPDPINVEFEKLQQIETDNSFSKAAFLINHPRCPYFERERYLKRFAISNSNLY